MEISQHTQERTVKVEVFCACGGAIRGRVKSSDPKAIEKIVKTFRTVHYFPDCKPCDAVTARKARQKRK
jgi:hypothetical protein